MLDASSSALSRKAMPPRVVIVGAGFGGLWAAKTLANAPVEVVVIDRENYHLFQPLLYQVATAGLSPADIAAPIRGIVGSYSNVTVMLGEVADVDVAGRVVSIMGGRQTPYDYLILARAPAMPILVTMIGSHWRPGLSASRMRRRFDGASCWPSSG